MNQMPFLNQNLVNNMHFTVAWKSPHKIIDKNGAEQWRREWLIPFELRPGFFAFWNKNKFQLKNEGFSVYKIDNDWIFTETKLNTSLFKKFPGQPEPVDIEPITLPKFTVKDTSGLREWQVPSVSKLCSAINFWGAAIDGSDMGTGKTYIACAVARELGMKLAIVCPKSVKEPWRRVICNHFKMKDQLVGITNYEQLRIGKKDSLLASFVTDRQTHRDKFIWKLPKNTLIVWDESQKLKNWKTKNSKTCIEAFKQGYKMIFCSATAATNPLELRTIGTVLKLFKNSRQYYDWAYQHGVYRGHWGMVFTDDPKQREEVLKKLHRDIFIDRGCRLSRDTIVGFPESEIIADCYNMDDEEVKEINKIYGEMAFELSILEKKAKRDKAAEMVAILRARQKVELLKIPLFIEMVQEAIENNMSVAVFVNFTETINALSKRLNTKCIYDGKVADAVRQNNVDRFQSDDERVILINIASGGVGLGIHNINGKYSRLALISPSYSAVLMRQSLGRVWREGSKSKSIQKIVFVSGTVEESVCKNVQTKLNNLSLLNDGDLLRTEKII